MYFHYPNPANRHNQSVLHIADTHLRFAEKSIKNAVFYNKHRINPFRGQIMMVSILLALGM